jgi:signal transduction histidine kinase
VKGDDLSTVLKGLSGNVKKMFEITCGLTIKGLVQELPPHTMVQMYKIAQEAVSNAIKHGKARQVAIGLSQEAEQLLMSIQNDGLPFSQPEASKNRMGLRIMNYRANTIGATLEIKPNKSGTVVTCSLPTRNGSKTSSAAGSAGKEALHEALAPEPVSDIHQT